MLGFDALAKLPVAGSPVTGDINASASITQASNTVSTTGAVQVKAALSQTQAGNSVSAAGAVKVTAALAQTQAGNTSSATGAVQVKGTLSQTQVGDTVASVAEQTARAELANAVSWTFDTDVSGWVASGAGAVLSWDSVNQRAKVEITAQQQGMSIDTLLGSGGEYSIDVTITNGASVSRSYRASLGAGQSNFVTVPAGATQTVRFLIAGATSSVLILRTAGIFTPEVGEAHYFDSVTVTLFSQAGNTVVATAAVRVVGTLSRTQAGDSVGASGAVQVKAALSQTQADNTNSATSAVQVKADLSQTQAGDSVSAAGTIGFYEAPCVIRASVSVGSLAADISITEAVRLRAAASWQYLVATSEVHYSVPNVQSLRISASVSYAKVSTQVAYQRIRANTCWDVVAEREAA